jgi:hypothetical protein
VAGELPSAHHRHEQIQQDAGRRRVPAQISEGIAAIREGHHDVSRFLEVLGEADSQLAVVVDDHHDLVFELHITPGHV